MFQSKKAKALKSLLKEANEHIKNYEFDKAAILYNKINARFELLPKKEKTENLMRGIDNINKGLILYLKINEAAVVVNGDDLPRLKDTINQINDIIRDLRMNMYDSYALVNYGRKYYEFYNDTYNSKYYEKKFGDKFNEVINLIKDKRISEASKQYHILLNYYRELIKYKDVNEIRPKLDTLLQDLEINKLIKIAQERVKPKKIMKPVIKEERISIQRLPLKPSNVVKFNPVFNEIHKLIRDNKYQEASKLFNNV